MNVLLVLAFLFFIGSILGWIIELVYRKVVFKIQWINPGFLTGPYLPIYGFGLCALFLLSLIDMSFIENIVLRNLVIIVFMGISLTAIEYFAGIIFVKGMNIKLWDYSEEFGNIQGIICPLYTFFWCILGGIYYFFIQDHIIDAVVWFTNNLTFSFVIGFFFGIFTLDIINSFNLVVKIKSYAKENEILVKFEELKTHVKEVQKRNKEKSNFIFTFRSKMKLSDLLAGYKKNNIKESEKK